MGRNTEAIVIALFAAIVAGPTLAVFSWSVIGVQPSGNHVQIWIVLSLAAMASAFAAARFMLAGSGIETYAHGLKLSVLSAGAFYLGWIFVFALIPALVGAPEGLSAFLSFFLRAAGHVIWTSGGLPVIVSVVGGLLYVAIKRRMIAPTTKP